MTLVRTDHDGLVLFLLSTRTPSSYTAVRPLVLASAELVRGSPQRQWFGKYTFNIRVAEHNVRKS